MIQHNPRKGESYGTRLLSATPTERKHKVLGENQGTPVRGTLTLRFVDGECDGFDWDGFDWEGTTLTEDEQQAVLDLFAD